MDILNNKKVLAGIAAGVVLVMVALFFVFSGGEGGGDDSAAPPEDSAVPPPVTATADSGAPAAADTGMPGTAAVAKAGKAEPPMFPGRADPFKPIVKPPGTLSPQERYIAMATQELSQTQPLTIYNERPTAGLDTRTVGGGTAVTDATQTDTGPDTTQRRMAGLVVGKNTYAILEVEGQTAVVKPGDILPDLSRVERIERDRILLRKGNRAITVPLSANPNAATGGGGAGGAGGYPGGAGGYRGGYRGPGSAPGGRGSYVPSTPG
jgi:hypothetical protein